MTLDFKSTTDGGQCEVSAVIPCRNNARTLPAALISIQLQVIPTVHRFIINDASTDQSQWMAQNAGFELVNLPYHAGRGSVRKLAIEVCRTDYLLSCDATNALDNQFLSNAVPWFQDPTVAAVFGRLVDPQPTGVASRWRTRHLFQQETNQRPNESASLCTWAYVARVSAILDVGNFDPKLRHSEDVELGNRLLTAGYKVVFEPKCVARPLIQNTIVQCLERHWRWYVARHGRMSLGDLKRWLGLAWRSMLTKDLQAHDPGAAIVSIILPFHHWWKSHTETMK